MVRGKGVAGKRELYELGHWSEAWMAERASQNTHFFCWVCKKEIHNISMYEHFSICCPKFFGRLNKYRGRRFSYVKQGGRSGFDPNGISPALQGEVLCAEPEEDIGPLFKDLRGENVKKEPEPISSVIGRLQDDRTDKEAQ